MITRFITSVSTSFNPFSRSAKTARSFLAHLPPNARQTMAINTKLLPRDTKDKAVLQLKFSESQLLSSSWASRVAGGFDMG